MLAWEVFSYDDFTMLVSLLRGIEVLAGVTTLLTLSFLALGTMQPEVTFLLVV